MGEAQSIGRRGEREALFCGGAFFFARGRCMLCVGAQKKPLGRGCGESVKRGWPLCRGRRMFIPSPPQLRWQAPLAGPWLWRWRCKQRQAGPFVRAPGRRGRSLRLGPFGVQRGNRRPVPMTGVLPRRLARAVPALLPRGFPPRNPQFSGRRAGLAALLVGGRSFLAAPSERSKEQVLPVPLPQNFGTTCRRHRRWRAPVRFSSPLQPPFARQ